MFEGKSANAMAIDFIGKSLLETALHRAAEFGHDTVVRLMLEEGADVEAKNGNGETALHVAARRGHEAVVQLLTSTLNS
jgi:ankyrin repeat protein